MFKNIPFVVSMLTVVPSSLFACASCGCSLGSEWETSDFSTMNGLKLDLRYDYLDQSQLWKGTSSISSGEASKIVNNGDPQEVEKDTLTRLYTVSIGYNKNYWGINLQLPYIDRTHSSLGTASDGTIAGADGGQYSSKTSSLGDIKLMGRYSGFSLEGNYGVLLGVKLPTGTYDNNGISTDSNNLGTVPIDRGLQPGTGTTDLIAGAFYHSMIIDNIDTYSQITYQFAIDSRDEYKPGNTLSLSSGVSYTKWQSFTPKLQINFRDIQKDSGANADTISTGGDLVYINPGISYNITRKFSLYGYVQVPVYQNVNGVQLVPHAIETIGLHYIF